MPDATGTPAAAPDIQATPPSGPSPPVSSAAGASPTPSSPAPASAGTPASPAATPPAPAEQGVLDYFKSRGYDLSGQFPDDHAALDHLLLAYRNAQQSSQLAQYGQAVLPHWAQFQEFLKQQQASQAQPGPAQKWWSAPEYDPSWPEQLVRDPAGNIVAKPGADPTLPAKYQAYQSWLQKTQHDFYRDPVGTLKPGLTDLITEVAQGLIQKQLGGYSDTTYAQQFVRENSDWLHQRDANKQLVLDPATGRPALSPEGRAFAGYVQQAERLGIADVRAQQDYAVSMLQRDLLVRNAAAATPQAQGDALKQQFLAQAANRPNAGGSIQTPTPQGTQPTQNQAASLEERLKRRFAEAGFHVSTPVIGNGN